MWHGDGVELTVDEFGHVVGCEPWDEDGVGHSALEVAVGRERERGQEAGLGDEDEVVVLWEVLEEQAQTAEVVHLDEMGIVDDGGVLRQHWSRRPNTREPRRGLSPRVACRNKWARIEALQRNQAFLDQYRGARADHLAGRDAVFPPGTWWLCRFAGLTCAELGATAPPS